MELKRTKKTIVDKYINESSINAYFRGAISVFDLRQNSFLSIEAEELYNDLISDKAALAAHSRDWEMVGDDMFISLNKYTEIHKEELEMVNLYKTIGKDIMEYVKTKKAQTQACAAR